MARAQWGRRRLKQHATRKRPKPRPRSSQAAGIDKALISHGTGHIHRQAAFAMLRVCVYPRIFHLLRCAYPSDVHGYAKRFELRRGDPERSREGSWDSGGGGGATWTTEAQAS
jgi:hypothetical protein